MLIRCQNGYQFKISLPTIIYFDIYARNYIQKPSEEKKLKTYEIASRLKGY